MNIIIRKAELADLKVIQDLNHDLFLSDADKDDKLNHNWPYEDGEDVFRRVISGELGVAFIAEVDGEVAGYVAGRVSNQAESWRPVRRSELENMLVKAGYRSHGVGRKLVQRFIKWSKDNNAERCYVSAYAANTRAIKFYEESGFEPYDTGLEVKLDQR